MSFTSFASARANWLLIPKQTWTVTGGEAGPSAKWYHAAFHTITAVVGVGVLGLPYSFSYLGWVAGVFALVATLAVSLYTAYLLSALHEEPDGTRHNRYVDLGRAILGKHDAVPWRPPESVQLHVV